MFLGIKKRLSLCRSSAIMSWADREGYIEHGGTIRCSWMTERGDELIKDLGEIK